MEKGDENGMREPSSRNVRCLTYVDWEFTLCVCGGEGCKGKKAISKLVT